MIGVEDLNVELFRELSEAFGPSGYEHRTVKIIRERIAPYADRITGDKTGSLIFEKKGQESPVILLAGHVDEVGFIVTSIHANGFLNFHPVGYWSDLTLLGQKVSIITKRGQQLTGLICAVPDFFAASKDSVIKKESMFIDIGCSTKEEVQQLGVRIGDPVVPATKFELIKDGSVAMGKAFDNRVGVFTVMEVLRLLKERDIQHPNLVVGAATVQEEVGIRGAKTTIATVKPDLAFAIDVDIAADVPGIPENKAQSKMGKGISIIIFDGTMIPNIWLREFVIELAERQQIPHQLSALPVGGTDTGVFHLYDRGCPSLFFGVPCRNIHTHVEMVSLHDVASAVNLLLDLLQVLDKKLISGFTKNVE